MVTCAADDILTHDAVPFLHSHASHGGRKQRDVATQLRKRHAPHFPALCKQTDVIKQPCVSCRNYLKSAFIFAWISGSVLTRQKLQQLSHKTCVVEWRFSFTCTWGKIRSLIHAFQGHETITEIRFALRSCSGTLVFSHVYVQLKLSVLSWQQTQERKHLINW